MDECLTYFQAALVIDPTYTDAHFNLGIAYQDKHQYKEALKCYENAFKLDPDFGDAKVAMDHMKGVVEQRKERKEGRKREKKEGRTAGKENKARGGEVAAPGGKSGEVEEVVQRGVFGLLTGN